MARSVRSLFLRPVDPLSAVGDDGQEGRTALLLLNSCSFSVRLVKRLWNRCSVRFCADGAANRLFASLSEEERVQYLPDCICGDFDSLETAIQQFYSDAGVQLRREENQDNNDFEKSLMVLRDWVDVSPGQWNVVAVGAFGGRLDQQMASFDILHRWERVFREFFCVDEENIAFLVSPGVTKIFPLEELEGPFCGLIALRRPSRAVTTSGLRWDLSGQSLELGKLTSTSNSISSYSLPAASDSERRPGESCVTIETSESLLWTCELRFSW